MVGKGQSGRSGRGKFTGRLKGGSHGGKGWASWYPCDARPRISGMILLLPILGPVDLSSL